MQSSKSAGRAVGLVMLLQVVVAPVAYFRMLPALTTPGAFETAAASALQIRAGLLLLLLAGAMSVVISIAVLPVVRPRSERMAFTLLVLSAAGLATVAAETIAARSVLAVSIELAKSSAPADALRVTGALTHSWWRSAHFTNLLISHSMFLFLWIALYRFAMVHRWLAAFGAVAATLSTTALMLPLLGLPFSFRPIVPVALANVALIAWLLVRGLESSATGRASAAIG